MTLKADVDQLAADAALFHAVMHGNDTATVVTDGGTVSSLAKAAKDASAPYLSASASAVAAAAAAVTATNAAATAVAVVTGGTGAVGGGPGLIPVCDGGGSLPLSGSISCGNWFEVNDGFYFAKGNSWSGAYSANDLVIENTNAGDAFIVSNSKKVYLSGADGSIIPGTDNDGQALGSAARRFSTVYAATGTINTSDAREKTAVSALTTAEINASKQLGAEIGAFKFLSAVAEKGEAARKHIGMTVQRAIEIMEANGLNPMEYGFICFDEWADEFRTDEELRDEEGNIVRQAQTVQTQTAGNRYGFRADELLMFIARGFEARLAALESV